MLYIRSISQLYGGSKMKKRQVLAIVLCAIMMLGALTGCGKAKDDKNAEETAAVTADPAEAKSQAQFECGKKTYDNLNTAADICIEMMDTIYDAWMFAIYDADEYTSSKVVAAFADEVNMTSAELETAWSELLKEAGVSGGLSLKYCLNEITLVVNLVTKAYELRGTTGELDTALENAKTELKTMTAEYADYSEYPTLKSYYAKVNSYAEFCKSPTGSFEQLKTTIQDYENEIRTYRADLEFIFEE